MVSSSALKLLPFVQAIIMYFVFVVEEPKGELWTTVLKCSPILGLMYFVLMHDFHKSCYMKKILAGLVFSMTGDALLNVDLFPHGMGAFAVAQICYISAFGLKPLRFWYCIPLYALGGGSEFFLH